MQSLWYCDEISFKDLLLKSHLDFVSWRNLVEKMRKKEGKKQIDELRELYMILEIRNILQDFKDALYATFSHSTYVGPSRATGERYYRIQELAVDQLDARGENLAMFLNALSHDKREDFSIWAQGLFGFSIKAKRQSGHVSVMLCEAETAEAFNLADSGYGFSQLLPVLAQIWSQTQMSETAALRILAIEQPELHLHPAFQTLVADAFVSAIRTAPSNAEKSQYTGLCIVVETHSESLVNRLGELINKKLLKSQDVSILIFDKPQGSEFTSVSMAQFDKEGSLRNWPYGFFSGSGE